MQLLKKISFALALMVLIASQWLWPICITWMNLSDSMLKENVMLKIGVLEAISKSKLMLQ